MELQKQMKTKLNQQYIPLISKFLEGEIGVENLWRQFFELRDNDSFLFSKNELALYPEPIELIISDLYFDLDEVDEHPERSKYYISEQELRTRCTKNLAKLIELTAAL